MTWTHHTRSREEWRKRYEKYLIELTEGRLVATRYFELSAVLYETHFEDLPEDVARQTLLPPDHVAYDEGIAASTTILYLRRFRLPR